MQLFWFHCDNKGILDGDSGNTGPINAGTLYAVELVTAIGLGCNDVTDLITWVNAPGAKSKITTNHWEGSGILVVIGDLDITGGEFDGVIWVEGELKVAGQGDVDGAILVAGGPSDSTKVTGNSEVEYDADAVSDAFEALGNIPPLVESWQEV